MKSIVRLLLTVVFLLPVSNIVFAAPQSVVSKAFKANNPDVEKFEFVRSYISALESVNHIGQRWGKASFKKAKAKDDVNVMREYVSLLMKDDMDWRVAKNYVDKYQSSPNALIRQTVQIFVAACKANIAIDTKEREIWDQWYAVKSNKLATRANERAFVKAQDELSTKHRDNNAKIVAASLLITKIMRSARNDNDKGHLLAITSKQRDILLSRLDKFGRSTVEWGLKPGQDHVQASVAVIREILEDPLYVAIDD